MLWVAAAGLKNWSAHASHQSGSVLQISCAHRLLVDWISCRPDSWQRVWGKDTHPYLDHIFWSLFFQMAFWALEEINLVTRLSFSGEYNLQWVPSNHLSNFCIQKWSWTQRCSLQRRHDRRSSPYFTMCHQISQKILTQFLSMLISCVDAFQWARFYLRMIQNFLLP